MKRLVVLALCVFLFSLGAPAQNPAPKAQIDDEPVITLTVDTELVQLPIIVIDNKDGRLLNTLEQKHFQIFEDEAKQDIKIFKHEDNPISVGMVIDNSGSMRNKRARVNNAALSFVREGNPEDETFIVNFDDAAYLQQDFTGSVGELVDALADIDPRGETALNDAVYLSLDKVREGKWEKKALLVISDGEDNVSKYGFNKVLEHVRESKNVTVYAIGLLDDSDGGVFGRGGSKKAKEELTKLAEATGGRAFFPKSLDEVHELCQRIAHDLRNQYTLGYTPSNSKQDGAWRTIRVAVTPPDKNAKLTIQTRLGYYAVGGDPNAAPPKPPEPAGTKKK